MKKPAVRSSAFKAPGRKSRRASSGPNPRIEARAIHRNRAALVEPLTPSPEESTWMVEGSGGELVVAQARVAGVEYVFANPGSFESGLFDALTDIRACTLSLDFTKGLYSPWRTVITG